MVGLYNGAESNVMIKNHNLSKELLFGELQKYKLLVTFNGSSFDIPLLERFFGQKIELPHIDLRHCCSRVLLTGGLKNIEKQLGITRKKIIERIYDNDPIRLWHLWNSTGKKKCLDYLI